MSEQEIVLKQLYDEQREEIKTLKEQNQRLIEGMKILKEQAEANGMDVLAYIQEFNDLVGEARKNLIEIKDLKRQMYEQKAQYQQRIEEAMKSIVGEYY